VYLYNLVRINIVEHKCQLDSSCKEDSGWQSAANGRWHYSVDAIWNNASGAINRMPCALLVLYNSARINIVECECQLDSSCKEDSGWQSAANGRWHYSVDAICNNPVELSEILNAMCSAGVIPGVTC
jgi:hypothetical protein